MAICSGIRNDSKTVGFEEVKYLGQHDTQPLPGSCHSIRAPKTLH